MKIIFSGFETQYKIYKITENINWKYYIGKTQKNIHERIEAHRKGDLDADLYFREIGYANIIVEIIDSANDIEELSKKEIMWIKNHLNDPNMLNVQFNRPKMADIQVDTSESKNMNVIRIWDEDENDYFLSIVE